MSRDSLVEKYNERHEERKEPAHYLIVGAKGCPAAARASIERPYIA